MRRDEHDALEELLRAREARLEAAQRYTNALKKCVELGFTNAKMARTVGVSETAIRLHRKRLGEV